MLIGAGLLPAASPAGAEAAPCQEQEYRVGGMAGVLCAPDGASTIQVLVPGGTYNRAYWTYHAPGKPSYTEAMNRAGYATLVVDRLGSGASSHPLALGVSAHTQADAVHRVIQTLRPRFGKVILGGHSIGSATTVFEAAEYHDVDGVLITALAHGINVPGALPVFADLIPANLDPKFRGLGNLGYLTTRAGGRCLAFFGPGHCGPESRYAAEYDERTKDLAAPGEAIDAVLIGNLFTGPGITRRITAPVMLVMGGQDYGFCYGISLVDCSSAEGLLRSEARFYGGAPSVHAYVVPGFGHSFNFAPNVQGYYDAVSAWTGTL
ncbi:alpha/beta fold hydrolase [Pseudonocardiaceae bacterium YIM PH 21723]|nr:alpha/beta fold hydrolase [Pseudonocardiaceae bacterium YIM PH 21723]